MTDNFTTSFDSQLTTSFGFNALPLVTIGETISGTTGALNSSTAGDYQPVGILDGAGAIQLDNDTVRSFVNHELLNDEGVAYTLTNEAANAELAEGETPFESFDLLGGRISYFDINTETFEVEDAGLAFNTIIDGNGDVAIDSTFQPESFATGLDEGPEDAATLEGFSRFCSGGLVEADTFGPGRGLVDNIYFAGEEDGGGFNSVGGGNWALDVATGTIYQVPALGRGSWENTTPVDTGSEDFVAFLLADDQSPFNFDGDETTGDVDGNEVTPSYLYVGQKDDSDPNDFLARNGLKEGKLYVFVPDDNLDEDTSNDIEGPLQFNGAGTSAGGRWVEIDNAQNLDLASENGTTGFDEFGFPVQGNLITQANEANALGLSRPEDVSTNPEDGSQVVQAVTGVDTFAVGEDGNGADSFGALYLFDTDFSALEGAESLEDVELTGEVSILYDGDEDPNRSLRSPDNLDFADDGFIYIQEDEAEEDTLTGEFLFGQGAANPNEAGIVRLDPNASAEEAAVGGNIVRVATVDRSQILDPTIPDPTTAVDEDFENTDDGIFGPGEIVVTDQAGNELILDAGEAETSGIVDVSNLFAEDPGTVFLLDVQFHGLADQDEENEIFGDVSDFNDDNLVEGGQLVLLFNNLETGTDGDEILNGSNDSESIQGLAGNDLIIGRLGDDDLSGGEGSDTLQGGEGNDFLAGNEGDDFLVGGTGSDTLNGGVGLDTADFNDIPVGVTADLNEGTASYESASGGIVVDSLISIENLSGSSLDDVLIGDDQANVISGVAGLDTLTGGGGEDVFVLGDEESGVLYSSFGFDDSAEISDFVSGEDTIQLAGSLEDYSILVDGGNNVAIALDNDGDGAFDLAFDEFIALAGSGFETTDLVFV